MAQPPSPTAEQDPIVAAVAPGYAFEGPRDVQVRPPLTRGARA